MQLERGILGGKGVVCQPVTREYLCHIYHGIVPGCGADGRAQGLNKATPVLLVSPVLSVNFSSLGFFELGGINVRFARSALNVTRCSLSQRRHWVS